MPTYEYQCSHCGLKFDRHQSMKDSPVKECPECNGSVQRIVSGGSGFIMKQSSASMRDSAGGCSFEASGKTCCGADRKCGQSPCGD